MSRDEARKLCVFATDYCEDKIAALAAIEFLNDAFRDHTFYVDFGDGEYSWSIRVEDHPNART